MVKARNTAQRQPRMESAIQQVVASMLLSDFTDRALQGVTVTQVELTGDLQHAIVYYSNSATSGQDNEEQEERTQKALNKAKGRFRTAVAQKLGSRLAPTIEFKADHLAEQVNSIENLLMQAQSADAALARARANAEYAGGENPYKTPRERVVDEDEA